MMKTEYIDIATPDGICDTFVAYPDSDADRSTYPAVILFMDAYGPRPYLDEMAQQLASHGYYVLLPNMFYRVKKAPVVDLPFPLKKEDLPAAKQQIMALINTFDPALAMQDTDVFLDFLARQTHASQGKIATTGYCMGGGLSLRMAARHPGKVVAAASFHGGRLATETPQSPHHLLGKIKAELYIAHADHDESMPPDQIERLNTALNATQIVHKAEVYAGASHGFTMADLPAYNQAALDRHWENLLDLLDRNLSAQK